MDWKTYFLLYKTDIDNFTFGDMLLELKLVKHYNILQYFTLEYLTYHYIPLFCLVNSSLKAQKRVWFNVIQDNKQQ